jgi:hypothetical protein
MIYWKWAPTYSVKSLRFYYVFAKILWRHQTSLQLSLDRKDRDLRRFLRYRISKDEGDYHTRNEMVA